MYRQIAEDLRQKIEAGELGHGTQLPTELELREQYDASRTTIRDAIRLLITRGLVTSRPGQGTFVSELIDPFVIMVKPESGFGLGDSVAYASDVAASGRRPTVSAARVRLPEDGRVVVFEAFRTSFDESGTPLRVTITVYPADRNQFVVNVGDVPPG
jgi:GntR family transcriptional regulator